MFSRLTDDFEIAIADENIVLGQKLPALLRAESLADILESTAVRYPHNVALIYQDRRVSYHSLNKQADIVASNLIAAGIGVGHIVGLWLPRGLELFAIQAGIAKSGAAWLPFDADTPPARIAACLEDAGAIGLISTETLINALSAHRRPNCIFTDKSILIKREGPALRRSEVSSADPAYVIYTSGSTGKPKGIQITHGAICHFLRSENEVLGVRECDKVYQGFSVSFDMFFEEVWISYLVGATLWVAPKEVAIDAEALVVELIAQEVTVLHTVPTFLGMLSNDIPTLRIINLGGELCPQVLVNRWSRAGRSLYNTYGPTETTVSASCAQLHVNHPVTIGTPLPNYGMAIVDASATDLKLLPLGEAGELCIFGPGVSNGYLGRPELTAQKFFANPWSTSETDKLLYRTGDLARINSEGKVECFGRTDDQVKIRGFRVELGEIEASLLEQENVDSAAVIVRNNEGIDDLIAFVVPKVDEDFSISASQRAIEERLPSYMVPRIYEVMSNMPRLTSGKIDRGALKRHSLSIISENAIESELPHNESQNSVFSALKKLFPHKEITLDTDFFGDLGGHSLLAARFVSLLRENSRFAHATVRDVYVQRKVGLIANALLVSGEPVSSAVDSHRYIPSTFKRWACGAAQAVAIPWLVGMKMMQWLAPFFVYHFNTGDSDQSIYIAVLMSLSVFLLATLIQFVAAIAAKWLIAGRLKAGNYELWGVTYFRWWLVDRLVESAPTYLLSGSSLYVWWLRALGASIGERVVIGSMTLRAHDLIKIGSGASIGNAVNFENARVENGRFLLGRIELGNESCVGSYALLEAESSIENYGHLEGLSSLAAGQLVPEGRVWGGTPAEDMGAFDIHSRPPRPVLSHRRLIGENLFFFFGSVLVLILFFMPIFPSFILIDWLDNFDCPPIFSDDATPFLLTKYFLLAFPGTGILIICTVLVSGSMRWLLVPRMKEGRWPVHSNIYCAKWLVNQIQEASLSVLHGIYATVFAPVWYRLLGVKVGKNVEISTALGVVPDMLTLEDETFVADAVMLGDEQIDGGWLKMNKTVISRRSFVGNGAYIPDGTILPENVLIGVHSRAPRNEMLQRGETWIGSPPINLPAREVVSGFPDCLTFDPSFGRRVCRSLVEAIRIVAPHALIISVGYTVVLRLLPLASAGDWFGVIKGLTVSGLLYGIGSFAFVAALKWLFLGRYQTSSAPMWTPFVWLSEGITNLYEGIAVPNFMSYLRGTPLLPIAFNILGAKIGRGVYLNTTDITEFDCVHIGEFSELNAMACPQTHLFEDRVMKIDKVHIGRRVYMGPRSTVLYGAKIGDGVKLGSLTLVMKGEHVGAFSSWTGCPAIPKKNILDRCKSI